MTKIMKLLRSLEDIVFMPLVVPFCLAIELYLKIKHKKKGGEK